jgi:hypothetical protein
MVGEPNLRSRATFRPFVPSVVLRVGNNIAILSGGVHLLKKRVVWLPLQTSLCLNIPGILYIASTSLSRRISTFLPSILISVPE